MIRRLVLFDIDGTLISTGGVGGRALLAALTEVFGTAGPIERWSFGGKTDPQIVAELMEAAGIDENTVAAGLPEVLARYIATLEREIDPARVKLKPGILPLLERLAVHPDVVLGLLTGNIARGAAIKLMSAGLEQFFVLGAYGCDHRFRDQLPPIAVRRAETLTDYRYSGKQVVIIGDTPNDIVCGRGIGVKAIAVATGTFPAADLALHGPDHLFADLSDTQSALSAILA